MHRVVGDQATDRNYVHQVGQLTMGLGRNDPRSPARTPSATPPDGRDDGQDDSATKRWVQATPESATVVDSQILHKVQPCDITDRHGRDASSSEFQWRAHLNVQDKMYRARRNDRRSEDRDPIKKNSASSCTSLSPWPRSEKVSYPRRRSRNVKRAAGTVRHGRGQERSRDVAEVGRHEAPRLGRHRGWHAQHGRINGEVPASGERDSARRCQATHPDESSCQRKRIAGTIVSQRVA